MVFSENNSNIAKAFSDAWGNVVTPKHNSKVSVKMKTGGSYTFEYTDMTGILDAVREMFKEHGIGIMQNAYTELGERGNIACVETMLLHSSGEWVKSYPLKFQAANSMQDFGGQITYMKRYSLSALLGLSTDKDDDSNGYSGNSYTQQNKAPQQQYNQPPAQQQALQQGTNLISESQVKLIKMLINNVVKATGTDASMVVEMVKGKLKIGEAVRTNELTKGQASAFINELKEMEQGE